MNIWHFNGRLGRDAELRSTQSGDKVLSFAVANDVGYGDSKTTQWVDCSIWGRRAEALAPVLKKGREVSVAGEVTLREFERRDGTTDKALTVRVLELDLHGGQSQGQGREADNGAGNGRSNGSTNTGRNSGDSGPQGGSNRQGARDRQSGQARSGSQTPPPRGQSDAVTGDGWSDIPF